MNISVIIDTSALVPEGKNREEAEAISDAWRIFDMDMKMCMTESIFKEYLSKHKYFPIEHRFREKFIYLMRETRRVKTCRVVQFKREKTKFKVHWYDENKLEVRNLSKLKENFDRKPNQKWDEEDEKFLKLFVNIAKEKDVCLVVALGDLKTMAEEAIKWFKLKENAEICLPYEFYRVNTI